MRDLSLKGIWDAFFAFCPSRVMMVCFARPPSVADTMQEPDREVGSLNCQGREERWLNNDGIIFPPPSVRGIRR